MYVCMFKYPLGDMVSKENSAYVCLTSTTLSRRLTMHLNDSNSIALHLKTHSIPKSKFRKVLVENTSIISHEIDKLRLHIVEAVHIKAKKNFKQLKTATMSWNALRIFFYIPYFLIVFYFHW